MDTPSRLPPWRVARWFNTPQAPTLEALAGRVVVVHAFQMLCPGCVAHGLPQAKKVAEAFAHEALTVVGLHTVFEHHAVMGAPALEVFLHEYRLRFPVGIDEPDADGGAIPSTMAAWGLRGTPSLVVFDKAGRARLRHFGALDDLVLGAVLGGLLAEKAPG